ncbi:putative quinol monooxygenase [Subtercola frigoramans]|uniref:Quinol monooxygenase YgiN n=1 Tax=Subtercola frigoramans TaxID=120298 RepID=A0ABS2L522_9MICO|nr:antibiotic biosynthesis monooxygenase [Subtercola frigoramans]MBM7472134.1 quinol monooxygenase YgiN [Subtercola frigoramans]
MTIVALLELHLKPEFLETGPSVLEAILTKTRAFPGSLGVETVTDVNDPAHIMVIERWKSIEADSAYRAWRAGDGASNLGDILAGPPTLTWYE